MLSEVIAAHFGTRVEYIGGTYDARCARDSQGRAWKVVSDASIAGPADEAHRGGQPGVPLGGHQTMQELVRKLRKAGAKADPSCVIHVHIGRGNHTAKTLRNLANTVNAKEDLLTQALQISPERRAR